MTKTKETRQELIANLREGLTIKDACALAGINRSTYYSWLENGSEEWIQEIKEAESYAKAMLVQQIKIDGTAKQDWRAAAWLLERRWPEDYGPKRELDLNVGSTSDKGTEMVTAMITQVQEELSPQTEDEDLEDTQDADD
jgi:hypothetical protein